MSAISNGEMYRCADFCWRSAITRIAPAPIRLLLKAPGLGRVLLRKLLVTRGACGPSGFRFSKPGSLEKRLKRAGFHSIRRELRAYPLEFATFEDYWNAATQGTPAIEMVKRMPPKILEEVKAELRGKLANANSGGVYIHNEAALVLGKKPA